MPFVHNVSHGMHQLQVIATWVQQKKLKSLQNHPHEGGWQHSESTCNEYWIGWEIIQGHWEYFSEEEITFFWL